MSEFRPHFATKDDLQRYVRQLADALRLRDWTIEVQDDPCDDDAHGQIKIAYGRRQAAIWLSRDNVELEKVRHTVVHELIHCHLEPMRWSLNNAQEVLGSIPFGIFAGAAEDALELAVDGLADAIAPHMPLPMRDWSAGPGEPPWPTGDATGSAAPAIWAEGEDGVRRPLTGARSITFHGEVPNIFDAAYSDEATRSRPPKVAYDYPPGDGPG
jgi:hypothetical protein